MRGLHQFLTELQAATSPEAEDACVRRELAHIRAKLQGSPKLDGYQRRKYLAKLVFMHIQGYRVDLSLMEAVSLTASMRDSEKQMGYLALTMLFEPSDMRGPVINVLRRDLESLRESHTCLALHALANMGTMEMAEELGECVLKLLVSATSPPAVIRKAALTLLHLVRKDSHCVDVWEWLDRIAPLIQSRDYGVAQSVVALVTELAGISPDACAMCYRPAVEQLHHVVMRPQEERELYHHVPLPWLQVKLLVLLQRFPRPTDAHGKALLQQCLQQLLRPEPLQRPMVDLQETHARYAVYFEAVHLAMHLDTTSILVARAAVHVGRLLRSEHMNVRYLALETMTQLAHTLSKLEPIRMHLDTIVETLRDRDTSVCRRALDLLYALCEEANVHRIVAHLLDYIPEAEASLRQDMALKVSLLVELVHCTDTALALLDMAGDKVGDKLWSRIAQTVTNRTKVQAYAAAQLLQYLRRAVCHETLIKLSTYVLSEYGYLVADQPGAAPAVQFELLHRHAYYCSPVTHSMLLSTYAKWYTQYPSLAPMLASVLRRSRGVFDMEIHQRASEYTALIELHAKGELDMDEIFDTLPPFPSQDLKPDDVGPGLFRLSKRQSSLPPVVTVPRGEARRLTRADEARRRLPPILPPVSPNESIIDDVALQPPLSDACSDLLDLSAMSIRPPSGMSRDETIQTPWALSEDDMVASPDGPLLGPVLAPPVTGAAVSTADLRRHSLDCDSSSSHDGAVAPGAASSLLLHETDMERMTCEIQRQGARVLVQVSIQNRQETTALLEDVRVVSPLQARILGTSSSVSIEPGQAVHYTLELLCTDCFFGDTELVLTLVPASRSVSALLPVTMVHFVEPGVLSKETFFEQWHTLGSAHPETQSVFALQTHTNSEYVALMEAAGLAVLAGIDPRPESFVMAGVLLPQGIAAKVLVRFEPHATANVARLTVRASDERLARVMHQHIVSQLARP